MENYKKNLIVTLIDKNFVDQAKQLFSSIYFNAGWEGDYMVLANRLSKKDIEAFKNQGILVYECEPLTYNPVGILHYPTAVLSKFYLFTEYFKHWQKIIFLDSDIIVKASLTNLEKLVGFNAACTPTWRLNNLLIKEAMPLRDEYNLSEEDLFKELKKEYKLDLNQEAFNAGVLVFDTDLISENTFSDLLSLYRRFESLNACGEEATLNLFFYDKWNKLPMIYNALMLFMNLLYRFPDNEFKAIIIHFVCSVKPWNKRSPYYKEWSGNLARFKDINLNRRLDAVKIWSQEEIDEYLIYLNQRYQKINKIFIYLRFLLSSIFAIIDRYIGLFGLFIKKHNPKLYKLIRLRSDLNER